MKETSDQQRQFQGAQLFFPAKNSAFAKFEGKFNPKFVAPGKLPQDKIAFALKGNPNEVKVVTLSQPAANTEGDKMNNQPLLPSKKQPRELENRQNSPDTPPIGKKRRIEPELPAITAPSENISTGQNQQGFDEIDEEEAKRKFEEGLLSPGW